MRSIVGVDVIYPSKWWLDIQDKNTPDGVPLQPVGSNCVFNLDYSMTQLTQWEVIHLLYQCIVRGKVTHEELFSKFDIEQGYWCIRITVDLCATPSAKADSDRTVFSRWFQWIGHGALFEAVGRIDAFLELSGLSSRAWNEYIKPWQALEDRLRDREFPPQRLASDTVYSLHDGTLRSSLLISLLANEETATKMARAETYGMALLTVVRELPMPGTRVKKPGASSSSDRTRKS